MNFWTGTAAGDFWTGISQCNIFLEKIPAVPDMEPWEKDQWAAEVKFLKAYYHFYLLQQYGPIPITDKNLPVSTSVKDVAVFRDPVDEVVNYIVNLLDEAALALPNRIENTTEELGRITKPVALAVKAKLLTMVASPLFNGNSNYSNLRDNRGKALFPQAYDYYLSLLSFSSYVPTLSAISPRDCFCISISSCIPFSASSIISRSCALLKGLSSPVP